jgi:hypothetical protein
MKNLHTFEEFLNENLNEALKDTREIVGSEIETIKDALSFFARGIGYDAVTKACKGKVPYTIFLKDKAGFPKSGGLHSSAIDFVSNSSNPKISVDDFIDILNTILDDHGFDKYEIKILK